MNLACDVVFQTLDFFCGVFGFLSSFSPSVYVASSSLEPAQSAELIFAVTNFDANRRRGQAGLGLGRGNFSNCKFAFIQDKVRVHPIGKAVIFVVNAYA